MTSPSPNSFFSRSLGKEKENRVLPCNWWWLLAFGMHFFRMVHNNSGKFQFTLPLLSWPEEGDARPCTSPETHLEDMKRCLLGPWAFVLQALLHLTQGWAEERLIHPPLLMRMALPPTRSWETLVSRCPMGTAELEIPEHNRVTYDQCNQDVAELPSESPCFKLSGVSPSWGCIPTCLQLPHKPQGLLSQAERLSKPPAESRSQRRDWEGQSRSRHPVQV